MTRTNIALLVLIACVAALPLFGDAYALRLGTMACMYAIFALSWNIVGGFAGYPSFATAAFFGLGAYTTGILMNKGVPLTLSLLGSLVLCLVLAAALGAVLLRLRGHYFAIASLSLVEVFRELVNNATDLTGGGMGLNIPLVSGSSVLSDATFFFYAMWGLLLITALVVIAVSMSKLGFGLNCIRQNETASNMVGLNSTLYKAIAFGLSACFVGAAGGLYAAWVHYIDPSDVFDILYSVKPIVMALMGGLGSPLGVVCGAFVYLGLEEVVWRNYIQIHSGVLGVLIILLLLFLPHGLVSLHAGKIWRGLSGRKAKHV
jgi:branched-chain amino acid transport system permease protein